MATASTPSHTAHLGAVADRQPTEPGIAPYAPVEEMEFADGSTARWGDGDFLVTLDVLISAGADSQALSDAADRMDQRFRTLTQNPEHPDTGRHGLDGGASLEWTEHPSGTALEARITSGGEDGLDSAEAAYEWLVSHCEGHPLTVTYGETWTHRKG